MDRSKTALAMEPEFLLPSQENWQKRLSVLCENRGKVSSSQLLLQPLSVPRLIFLCHSSLPAKESMQTSKDPLFLAYEWNQSQPVLSSWLSRLLSKRNAVVASASYLYDWLLLYFTLMKTVSFLKNGGQSQGSGSTSGQHTQQCNFMLLQNKAKTSDPVWGWRISLLFLRTPFIQMLAGKNIVLSYLISLF